MLNETTCYLVTSEEMTQMTDKQKKKKKLRQIDMQTETIPHCKIMYIYTRLKLSTVIFCFFSQI